MSFTWTNPAVDGAIKVATVTEIRTNLDSIKDNLECNTHHSARFAVQYVTDKAGENSNNDATQDVSLNSTRHSQVDNNQHASYYGAKQSTYRSSHLTGYYGDRSRG